MSVPLLPASISKLAISLLVTAIYVIVSENNNKIEVEPTQQTFSPRGIRPVLTDVMRRVQEQLNMPKTISNFQPSS